MINIRLIRQPGYRRLAVVYFAEKKLIVSRIAIFTPQHRHHHDKSGSSKLLSDQKITSAKGKSAVEINNRRMLSVSSSARNGYPCFKEKAAGWILDLDHAGRSHLLLPILGSRAGVRQPGLEMSPPLEV